MNRAPALLALLLAMVPLADPARAADPTPAALFRETVRPILARECFGCHSSSAKSVKAGLKLDTHSARLKGGDSGPALVPGKPAESLLLQAIRHEDGMEMPPGKPRLAEKDIQAIRIWIEQGAPAPDEAATADAQSDPRRHWAFQPVKRPDLPDVARKDWPRGAIDRFILARLESKKWSPSPPADRLTWLRRVTFDLTGLPPTPEEQQQFVKDSRPDAFERVADRLLASPRYGERWAQHWLDLVRFAESEGYEYDRHIPDAWRYRDYVIESLNADKPYDRFLTEQIAGDEIAPDDPTCQVATAFHRLGPVRRNAGNPEIALSRNEVLTERTDIIGSAFLGLTIGCARCHNHKLEPISQKDYYRLQAYLAASDENNIAQASQAEQSAWKKATEEIQGQIKEIQARAKKASGAAKEKLFEEAEALETRLPAPPATIPATRNDMKIRTIVHVLKRGEWERKGEPVGPRPPEVLIAGGSPELPGETPNPRSQLASWIASRDNPLTARVYVNRVWQHHFGTGLVRSVNDFGTKAQPPSHPELLDWLASEFVAGGWRIKPIHRLIILSSTYRQTSKSSTDDERAGLDPENRLLWRMTRRRLSAEEIRDAMLIASGRLNLKLGGPSVMIPVDKELVNLLYKPSQWKVTPDAAEHDRRSIYLMGKRNLRLPFFEVFDAPTLLISCGRRESSTHAPQALEMFNGTLANDLALAFANRLEREGGGNAHAAVDRAFRLVLGRRPTDREASASARFLETQPLREFTLALFNTNGFFYVP